jgi:Protein of unknown function (DUF1569)
MDSYLQSALREMELGTEGMSDGDLNGLRLAPGKWTAAQTMEHLVLTFTSTTKYMHKVSKEGTSVPAPTLKQRIGTFVVTGLGHIPEGRKAPEFARPLETSSTGIIDRFRQAIHDMDEAITATERLRAKGARIAMHPIVGPLTAVQWRKFHLVHTRHHMKQIRAMRQSSHRAEASAA